MSGSKDPMLRGEAAPSGYAASVSGWLQSFVAQTRLENPSANMAVTARLNVLDGCSSFAVAVGDDDPRVRILSLACPGSRWTPGPQQLAAVQGAGHKAGTISGVSGEVDDKLTGDKLLSALALAAVLDMHTAQARELSKALKNPEAAPSPTAVVEYERQRADNSERLFRVEREAAEHERVGHIRERDLRRHYQALCQNAGLVNGALDGSTREPSEPKRQQLPAGVRQRGSTFQAFWRGVSGRQEQQGGFATAEEAKAHRTAEMERVAKERQVTTVPEMSAGPPPEFNPSPEERAAMQEEATR